MSSLISVDYDFFIRHGMYDDVLMPDGNSAPGQLIFDWQMNEGRAPEFDESIWISRAASFKRWGLDIQEMTKPELTADNFMTELSVKLDGNALPGWRGDSHAWAGIVARDYSEIHGPLDVVNFDAHHDLGYERSTLVLAQNKKTGKIGCDTWALIGLQENWIKNYTLVYPDWLGKKEWKNARGKNWLPKRFQSRVHVTTWSEWLEHGEIEEPEVGFFARSSSWVPPWYDAGFQELCDEWGYVDCIDCQIEQSNTPYDTCKPRPWDWNAVDEHADMWEQLMNLRAAEGI